MKISRAGIWFNKVAPIRCLHPICGAPVSIPGFSASDPAYCCCIPCEVVDNASTTVYIHKAYVHIWETRIEFWSSSFMLARL